MSWIAEVHESAAEGRLKECYERIVKALGRMIPFYRIFRPSPRLLGAKLTGAPRALTRADVLALRGRRSSSCVLVEKLRKAGRY